MQEVCTKIEKLHRQRAEARVKKDIRRTWRNTFTGLFKLGGIFVSYYVIIHSSISKPTVSDKTISQISIEELIEMLSNNVELEAMTHSS